MGKFIEELLLTGLLIIFGATAHAMAQLSYARRDSLKFDWIDFTIALVISAFSGTIFGIVAAFYWEDTLAIHAVAGVGAFLGLKGLNSLSDTLITALTSRVDRGGK